MILYFKSFDKRNVLSAVLNVQFQFQIETPLLALSVAYLGFRGGGSKYFCKSGGIFMALFALCSAWLCHAFARGVRGYAPPRQFLKMVRLENILLKFCKKNL